MLNFITWDFDPVALSWPLQIRWYSLMFAIGFWLGVIVVGRMFRREGAPERWVSVLLNGSVPVSLACALMDMSFEGTLSVKRRSKAGRNPDIP